MKSTKIMLAVIATFLITWCVMGLIGYLLSDLSYKECMTHDLNVTFLCIFGWAPAAIIGRDIYDKLD